MNTQTVSQRVELESQIEHHRKRADQAERDAARLQSKLDRVTALVAEMDRNRDGLGDSCRICGERIWAGPNGERRPHHTQQCPVARTINNITE